MSPGTKIKIMKGDLRGLTGQILDPNHTFDSKGNPFPRPAPGFYLVEVTLSGGTVRAILFAEELEEC